MYARCAEVACGSHWDSQKIQLVALSSTRPDRGWSLDYFWLRLELLAEGNGGFSLSFGDVGGAAPLRGVGASGAGAGLRLLFRTSKPRTLSVLYAGVRLRSVPLFSSAAAETSSDAFFDAPTVAPAATFGTIDASYRDDGLHVAFDGTELVRGMPSQRARTLARSSAPKSSQQL